MPSKVEDRAYFYIRELETFFETLSLYIDVELGIAKESNVESNNETMTEGDSEN
jgi:hypothetical protein